MLTRFCLPYKFTGKELDPETGSYSGARYLDSAIIAAFPILLTYLRSFLKSFFLLDLIYDRKLYYCGATSYYPLCFN